MKKSFPKKKPPEGWPKKRGTVIRRLFTAASALSLLLCAATVVL